LRRVLLGENRKPKAVLGRGEHKSLQTDRVVLQPGPAEEVETVGRMFRLVLDEYRSPGEIAEILNSEGIMTDLGLRWTATSVRGVLTNEKYVGNNVFHRTSSKLANRELLMLLTSGSAPNGSFRRLSIRSCSV
jgi:hypothetical protein